MCHICCDSIDHIIIESENIITTWVDYYACICISWIDEYHQYHFSLTYACICISWYWVSSIPWIWKEYIVRTICKLNAHTINQYEKTVKEWEENSKQCRYVSLRQKYLKEMQS